MEIEYLHEFTVIANLGKLFPGRRGTLHLPVRPVQTYCGAGTGAGYAAADPQFPECFPIPRRCADSPNGGGNFLSGQ